MFACITARAAWTKITCPLHLKKEFLLPFGITVLKNQNSKMETQTHYNNYTCTKVLFETLDFQRKHNAWKMSNIYGDSVRKRTGRNIPNMAAVY